jgi:hypothetical protein
MLTNAKGVFYFYVSPSSHNLTYTHLVTNLLTATASAICKEICNRDRDSIILLDHHIMLLDLL